MLVTNYDRFKIIPFLKQRYIGISSTNFLTCRNGHVQESGIRQNPGTRGHGSDGPFLGEAKFTHSAY